MTEYKKNKVGKFILLIFLLISFSLGITAFIMLNTRNQTNFHNIGNNFVTFIIPTIGRDTLKRTVDSLINQTDPSWNAIIIFDNIKPNLSITDSRIKIIETTKKIGEGHNSAGNVRNIGMKEVNSQWIAFVDDDDTLSNNYVVKLKKDSEKYPNINTIIFRMLNSDNRILPPPDIKFININEVGISFAVKRSFVEKFNLYFKSSDIEDFNYLKNALKFSPILIASNLTYFVRDNKNNVDINKKFKEIIIDH